MVQFFLPHSVVTAQVFSGITFPFLVRLLDVHVFVHREVFMHNETSDRMVRLPLSRSESVTALICSGRNRTEPDTGYSHLLACSLVTYRGRNAAHIHLPLDDVTYSSDQTLQLTVMLVVCSIIIIIIIR